MFNRKKDEIDRIQTREGRFKKVASRRVDEILNKLRLLGNCSNKANYAYDEEQARKIFSAIDVELRRIKILFSKPNKKNKFSLE